MFMARVLNLSYLLHLLNILFIERVIFLWVFNETDRYMGRNKRDEMKGIVPEKLDSDSKPELDQYETSSETMVIDQPEIPSDGERYVGNVRLRKFHRPECRWTKKIAPENMLLFESTQDALDHKYSPCKVCRPLNFQLFSLLP